MADTRGNFKPNLNLNIYYMNKTAILNMADTRGNFKPNLLL